MINPFFAYVSLQIGELDITANEEHFIDMTNVKLSDGVTQSVVFNLYDDSAILLEGLIVQGENKLIYYYGYSGGARSRTYEAMITKYYIDFVGQGTRLTIEAVPQSALDATNPSSESYEGLTIDQIVRQIADQNGWLVGTIAACKPVYETSTEVGSISNYKNFIRYRESDQEFINRIARYAETLEGEKGFIFTLVEDANGTTVNFAPKGYEAPEGAVYTYVIGQENDKVISFTPQFNDSLIALMGGGELLIQGQDPLTNEYVELQIDNSTVRTDFLKIKRQVAGSSYSFDEMKTIAKDVWSRAVSQSYPATLVVRGDLSVEPLQAIEILIMTVDSMMHHSSGTYYVTSVEDVISGGTFITTMKLNKNIPAQTAAAGTEAAGSAGGIISGSSPSNPYSWETTDGSASKPAEVPSNALIEAINKYLGTPYKQGGMTKQTGLDASAFVYLVYKELGMNIPKMSGGQRSVGSAVSYTADQSNLQPGDLIFWKPRVQTSIGDLAVAVTERAVKELGYHEGTGGYTKYGEWYGVPCGAWCAMFVSWCAEQIGIPTSIITKHGSVSGHWDFHKGKSQYYDRSGFNPQKGDLFIQKRNGMSHIGYVYEGLSNSGKWKSIEGNWGDKVQHIDRGMDDKYLSGFCRPNYGVPTNATSGSSGGTPQVSHVAIYVGAGYVAQASAAYGSVHYAKLNQNDIQGIDAVKRLGLTL